MKKNILFSVLVLFSYLGFSQENSEATIDLKRIGIGLQIEQLKYSDIQLSNEITPITKIFLTYNLNNHIRIEPDFGLLSLKRDNYKSLGFHYGLSSFWMVQRGKTNIYCGLTLGYDILNASDKTNSAYNTSHINNIKANRFIIGPKIGGEYFLGNHFSLSGEISLLNSKGNYKEDAGSIYYQNNQDYKFSSFAFESGLLIHFYF